MTLSRHGIDQAICWALLEAKRIGLDVVVGDVVRDLTIPHIVTGNTAEVDGGTAVDSHVDEASVEQRHVDAIGAFLENYAMGVTPWTVTFRVPPPEPVETEEPVAETKAPGGLTEAPVEETVAPIAETEAPRGAAE